MRPIMLAVYVSPMKINRDDVRAPAVPPFAAPCGSRYNTSGELMAHVQVCGTCIEINRGHN